MIAWIPFAIGWYRASQLRESLTVHRQMETLLSEMSRSLRLTRRPPDEILLSVAQTCDCSLLAGADGTLTCDSIGSGIRDPLLKDRVCALFHSLRSADAVSADEVMKEAIDWLSEKVAQEDAACCKKAPLYTKLGALISLFVIIILL